MACVYIICSEEEKCILVKVTTPGDSSATESDNLALASCTVKYFDVLNSRPVQHRVDCTIVLNPNTSTPVTSDCVDDIEQHRLRCEVADALGEANKMANTGNFANARGVLQRACVRVRGSRVCRQVLARHLLETLQESLEGIQDKVTYINHGKALIHNYTASHYQQRSNTTPSQDGYVKRSSKATPTGLLQAKSSHTAREAATGVSPRPFCSAPSSADSVNPYRNSHKMRIMAHYSSVTSKGKKK